MKDRFAEFPRDLASRSRIVRLGDIPALLAHPDWKSPAPTVVWLHGRTANKELDPGRYLRWVREGLAACAIDLPGHGERFHPSLQGPEQSLEVLERAVGEIDRVVEALADPAYGGAFDLDRLGIGGMSLGGMVALRRLGNEHPFSCAAVEATTGWLEGLYFPERVGLPVAGRWIVPHVPALVRPLDPMANLEGFRPIPLLALHSEADQIVPFVCMKRFLDALREHYSRRGSDPSLIELETWPKTGAPQEHVGFGRLSNEAKTMQTEFLKRHLTRSRGFDHQR